MARRFGKMTATHRSRIDFVGGISGIRNTKQIALVLAVLIVGIPQTGMSEVNGRGAATNDRFLARMHLECPSQIIRGIAAPNALKLCIDQVVISASIDTNKSKLEIRKKKSVRYMSGIGYALPTQDGIVPDTFYSSRCDLNFESEKTDFRDHAVAEKCPARTFDRLSTSVLIWGADPTGIKDSAPAFERACAAMPGGRFYVPPGLYYWNSAETFKTPCQFVGAGWNERNQQGGVSPAIREGTWFYRDNASFTPMTFAREGGTGGLRDIAFEEKQSPPTPEWTPAVYPPWVNVLSGGRIEFDHLMLWGIYGFLSAPDCMNSSGRILMTNISGQVFGTVYTACATLDIVRFDNWHIWPFWSDLASVVAWQQQHSTPIVLKRCDGIQAGAIFIFGAKVGLTLGSNAEGRLTGATQNANFNQFYCDACKIALKITGNWTRAHFGSLVTMAQTPSGRMLADSYGILDTSSGSSLSIDRWEMQGVGQEALDISNAIGEDAYVIGSSDIFGVNADGNPRNSAFHISASTGKSVIKFGTYPNLVGPFNGASLASANGNIITDIPQAWKPAIIPVDTRGTPIGSAKYLKQTGVFEINGDQVTVHANLQFSINADASHILFNLPFKNTSAADVSASIGYLNGFLLSPYYTFPLMMIRGGGAKADLLQGASGQSTVFLPGFAGTAYSINFTATYPAF